jgi:AraC family transcriptional regulator
MNGPSPPSYSAWLLSEGFRPLAKQHHAIGGLSASLFRILQDRALPDPPTPDVTVQLLVRGRLDVRAGDLGAGRFAGKMRPGDFGVTPDGVPAQVEGTGRSEFLVLAMPGAEVRAMAGRELGRPVRDFGRLHAGLHRDDRLAALLGWLWQDAEAGGIGGRLFADGALTMVVARLLAHAEQPLRPPRGGLAPWQLKRVLAAMEAAPEQDMGLAELAALVGLSPFHFARAFKASTGEPPHRYRMRRRVERAKELLAGSGDPVTEIAHACGFASSQHLATVFRRLVGTTPTAFRREAQR